MNTGADQLNAASEARRHLDQAYAWDKSGEFRKALNECELAIELDPQLAEAHNLRGMMLEELGFKTEAQAAYREAVRLAPGFEDAAENMRELETELLEQRVSDEINDMSSEDMLRILRSQQNLAFGILAAAAAAAVSAILWALITVRAEFQIGYMAVGVGLLVGFAVRWAGKGVDKIFGVTGAVFALLGCLAGNILTVVAVISQETSLPVFDLLISLDVGFVLEMLTDTFQAMDLLFYGLAIYEGYRFAFRKITPQLVDSLNQEIVPYKRPQPAKSRNILLPAIAAAVFLCVAGIAASYFLRQVRGDLLGALDHNERGNEHWDMGEFDQAAEEYLTATQLYQDNPVAHNNLGWAYMFQGNLSQAAASFSEALRIDPSAAEAYDGLGWVYYNQATQDTSYDDPAGAFLFITAKQEAAVEAFNEAISLNPEYADAYDGLGYTYSSMGKFAEATDAFREAVRLEPSFAHAYGGLGVAYYLLEEFDRAADAFQKAIDLDPLFALNSFVGLGNTYLSQDEPEMVEGAFQDALDIEPGEAEAHLGLGWVYMEQERYIEAYESLLEAVTIDPLSIDGRLGLGMVQHTRGEPEQALEQYESIIETHPDLGIPHALSAMIYYDQDQPEKMEQALQQALNLRESDATTGFYLGGAYNHMREFSTAEKHLLEAIKLSPDSGSYYLALTQTYAAQKKFDDAFQAVDQAAELGEDESAVLVAKSYIYRMQELPDLSLEALLAAQELEPNDAEIHSALSFTHFLDGEVDKALVEAQEAVILQPYNQGGHLGLAFAHHALGNLDLAQEAAAEALRLSPKSDLAHYVNGLIYMDQGEDERAVDAFEEFLDLYWDRAYARQYKDDAERRLDQLR